MPARAPIHDVINPKQITESLTNSEAIRIVLVASRWLPSGNSFRDKDTAKCDKIDNEGDTRLPGYSSYDRKE